MQTVYQSWNVPLTCAEILHLAPMCLCRTSEAPIAAYATVYGLIHNHRYICYNIRCHTQPSLHMLQHTVSYTTIAVYTTIHSLRNNHRCIRYNIQVPKTNSFSPSSLQRTQPNTPHIEQDVGLASWTDVLDWRLGLTCWTGCGTGFLD